MYNRYLNVLQTFFILEDIKISDVGISTRGQIDTFSTLKFRKEIEPNIMPL